MITSDLQDQWEAEMEGDDRLSYSPGSLKSDCAHNPQEALLSPKSCWGGTQAGEGLSRRQSSEEADNTTPEATFLLPGSSVNAVHSSMSHRLWVSWDPQGKLQERTVMPPE